MNQEPKVVKTSKTQKRSLVVGLVSSLLIIGLAIWIFFNGWAYFDSWRAANFHPSQSMAAAVDRLQLTARGQDILYATSPVIEDKTVFNNSCQSQERTAAILGCYYLDRIYILAIHNQQLDGAVEVTTAHEMLHAAYNRLNMFERKHIDDLLRRNYEKIKHLPELEEVMKYYRQAEPGSEVDELHSILGTTIASLDTELEAYYSRYFHDRSRIVALNASYNKVFADLKSQANSLSEKIKAAQPSINNDLAAYEADRKQLEYDIQSFNQEAASGGFTTRGAFNAARNSLIGRVDTMNRRQTEINQRVDQYNADIATLNALSVQVQDLYQSINGAEATAGGV